MSALFEPLSLRSLTLSNRVAVSPMCQYSAVDGLAQPWHLVHLGSFATGGAGLILTEATAVTPEGRISPDDLGLWSDAHADALAPIVDFVHSQGTALGIQLAHAGRKASTTAPWKGHDSVPASEGGWPTIAPSSLAFADLTAPAAMTEADIAHVRQGFVDAAARAARLGVDTVEIHAAHGYLLHEFLSPLSNHRDDDFGGSLANRMRLVLQVIDDVRTVWPDDRPLLMRVSATDWVEGGWTIDDTVHLAREARQRGVDLVDVSSAGLDPRQAISVGPGFQVPFAARVRADTPIATGAVGLITEPDHADAIVAEGSADLVLLGRAMLREPRWPLRAAAELGDDIAWPPQYQRARR